MEILQHQIISEGINEQRNREDLNLQKCLEERVSQKEKLWHQKSHINWLKCGESNSVFFHHSIIQYIRHNRVMAPKTREGNLFHSHQDIVAE